MAVQLVERVQNEMNKGTLRFRVSLFASKTSVFGEVDVTP
jgi:hypothetical protein